MLNYYFSLLFLKCQNFQIYNCPQLEICTNTVTNKTIFNKNKLDIYDLKKNPKKIKYKTF